MKQSSYIVYYKDSPKANGRYFGPFASIELAGVFLKELPEPLEGGSKGYRITQPHTMSDINIIRGLLGTEREKLAA